MGNSHIFLKAVFRVPACAGKSKCRDIIEGRQDYGSETLLFKNYNRDNVNTLKALNV